MKKWVKSSLIFKETKVEVKKYIMLIWKEKVIRKREKLFTYSCKRVVRRGKIECPYPSCVWRWYWKIVKCHFPLNINKFNAYMSLLSLRNFIYITLMYNTIELSNFDKNVLIIISFSMFLIMIKICPLKYLKKYKMKFNGLCIYIIFIYLIYLY